MIDDLSKNTFARVVGLDLQGRIKKAIVETLGAAGLNHAVRVAIIVEAMATNMAAALSAIRRLGGPTWTREEIFNDWSARLNRALDQAGYDLSGGAQKGGH